MQTALNTATPVAYPIAPALDSANLTVPVVSTQAAVPLPDEAIKEHVLDAIALLEANLTNPALNALCSVALSWYLDMLTGQQIANLSERMQLLIQRVAVQHSALAA
ncbi:hypothetical protein [Fibrella forsythiae]|uniref:Cell division protein ZapA n=1 Tax=Fibrella forsythiae TaxID=2817061 RepID=A0ABS3JUE2_9BACT|nr:hypothetical protein [Fibrella forsythiae]MBO0953083.1 hypothetical protein [Fibrella forsythiae]